MGTESRFERIINDAIWGQAACSIAFEGLANRCLIEKALHKEARDGRFCYVRSIALHYEHIYRQQADRLALLSAGQILEGFSRLCKPMQDGHPMAFFFKEFACRKLRQQFNNQDWYRMQPCLATKMLIHEFLIDYARKTLGEASLKAQKEGHGSAKSLQEELDKTLSTLRLEKLVDAILEGSEKSARSPVCKKERIEVQLSKSLLNGEV